MTTVAIKPGSHTEAILNWYRDHPGFHRCMDVSAAVEIKTHPVAVTSARLYDRGLIQRKAIKVFGRARPVAYYGIPAGTEQATTAEEA